MADKCKRREDEEKKPREQRWGRICFITCNNTSMRLPLSRIYSQWLCTIYIYIYISWWIIFIYRFLSSRLIISLRWLFQTCLISMLVILSEVLSSKARLYKKMSSNKCRSLVRYYLIDHWCVASMSILPGHDNLNTRFSLFFFRS
jgi:hypothetical protein